MVHSKAKTTGRHLRVHDLRHTVGMRLREANVRENTVADILWHEHSSMTGHYSVAQIDELVAALDLIADEQGRANKTLQVRTVVHNQLFVNIFPARPLLNVCSSVPNSVQKVAQKSRTK